MSSPILLAITGASGSIYAIKFLELMKRLGNETHLIISDAGRQVVAYELGAASLSQLKSLSACQYDVKDLAATPASGSSAWRAMIVLPCTMGTLASIANGLSTNLIHRAADCFLKERRQLVLCIRETPFNRTHLKNMLAAQEAGAAIFPAMPAFYHKPKDLDEMAAFFASRVAQFIGIDVPDLKRWQGISN